MVGRTKKNEKIEQTLPGVTARFVLQDHRSALVSIIDGINTKQMFHYENGVYRRDGRAFVRQAAENIIGVAINKHYAGEVEFHVAGQTCQRQGTAGRFVSLEDFDTDVNLVNLSNGLVDLRSGELRAHSPKYLSLVQLPIVYDQDADCPAIRKFLTEVVSPDDAEVLLEAFGYCLYKAYPIHRALMLLGSGSNGKSTLLEVLRTWLGKRNCAAVPMQELETDRFAKAQLYGKLANLFADLKTTALMDTGVFKTLTGGDTISAEHKNQDRFEFMNYAKLIFSANQPPRIYGDDSMALWRRQIMIEFPNTFEGANRDEHLLEKLTTQQEMSGLLNVALVKLRELLIAGDFAYAPSHTEVRSAYRRLADPMAAFVDDCCQEGGSVAFGDLYKAYRGYCKENNGSHLEKQLFARALKKHFPDALRTKTKVGGIQVVTYYGVSI